jgi:hypothetical protein
LDSGKVSMIESDRVSPELKLLNDRQMASWKFSVDFSESRVRAALRYCLQLSQVRRPCPRISNPRYFLTDVFSWRKVRRKRFFRPLVRHSGVIPVFDCVLLSQETHDWELPPTYQQSVEQDDEAWIEPPKLRRDPCGTVPDVRRRPDIVWISEQTWH